jgi:hypothetical protein
LRKYVVECLHSINKERISSNTFREQVEEYYGSKIEDEFWQSVTTGSVGQALQGNVEATAALIRLQADIREENQKLKAENQKLKQQIQ